MNTLTSFTASFIVGFLLASGGLYVMNATYNNIWKFDFRSIEEVRKLKEEEAAKEQAAIADSTKMDADSISVRNNKPENKNSEVKKPEIESKNKNERTIPQKVIKEKIAGAKNSEKNSADYIKWAKQTAKIYESMEARSAAKIIMNYSDNIARDILYFMNKKKAAGVLAVLDPKIAMKITRAE